MNWNLIVGPVCLLLGLFIALYVKDTARNVAKLEFAEQIKFALSTFKTELLASLDTTYCRFKECELKMSSHDDRLDVISEAVKDLESKE